MACPAQQARGPGLLELDDRLVDGEAVALGGQDPRHDGVARRQAAAAPESQSLLLVGTVILLPIILAALGTALVFHAQWTHNQWFAPYAGTSWQIGGGALISTYWIPGPLVKWDLPWATLTGIILLAVLWFNKGRARKKTAIYLMALYTIYLATRTIFFGVD